MELASELDKKTQLESALAPRKPDPSTYKPPHLRARPGLSVVPTRTQAERRQANLDMQATRKDEIVDLIHKLDQQEHIPDWDLEGPGPGIPKAKNDIKFMDYVAFTKRNRDQAQGKSAKSDLAEDQTPPPIPNDIHNDDEIDQSESLIRGERFVRPRLTPPCKLMLSEWLEPGSKQGELDLGSGDWFGLFCPVGKRVLIIAARGKTRVFSRRNQYLGYFESDLPGGKPVVEIDGFEHRGNGVTILDCIWSEPTETLYVLDVIAWNSFSHANRCTSLRTFFVYSKIMETTSLLCPTTKCPIKFVPLVMVPGDKLVKILTTGLVGNVHGKYFQFPEEIDGLLLFDKRGFYIHQITPLVLWVLLPELSDILGITPCAELLDRCRPVREDAHYYLKKPDIKNGRAFLGGGSKNPGLATGANA